MQAVTIGLDLAKTVFQVHGVDSQGKVVLVRQLRRKPARWGTKVCKTIYPVAPVRPDLSEATAAIRATDGVVEALMSGGSSYWISMYNKGGSHKGYAQYACVEMPQGVQLTITIWDAAEMARGNLVALVKYYCDKK